jgi:Protein of unknown function (DUF1552)
MIITKMALPRRTFLRGLGVTMALPFLDAMVPALSAWSPAKAAAETPTRLAFFHIPNGAWSPHFHPKTVGADFELTPILQSLAPVREQLIVFSGLHNAPSVDPAVGGGSHERSQAGFLTGVRPATGPSPRLAKSLDQYAIDRIGQDTQLKSLQLSTEPNPFGNGAGGNDYVSAYTSSMSWTSETTPVPMENNPRQVFERLFGDGATGKERALLLRRNRSILDSVTGEMKGIERKLGAQDRATVAEYLSAVREVERIIQKAESKLQDGPVELEQPAGVPEKFEDHARLLLDLLLLAFQADITRVACFRLARDGAYSFLGVPEGHHNSSHHQKDAGTIERYTKVVSYNTALFAYLAARMKTTRDGDGTLLDRSMLWYGSGLGDGDLHEGAHLPIVLVGGMNGQLKGGRHLKYADRPDVPLMNLGLTVLDKVGVELASIGDSTGRLTDL